jgi:hypothetical protein
MWRVTLAREIAVSKPMASDFGHYGGEALRVSDLSAFVVLAVVVSEYLFVNVA